MIVVFPCSWAEESFTLCFYSASALLAMQSAVLATGIPSVRLSVRPSVTFRYCVQMKEDTMVRFSASGRTIPLVSGEVKFIRIFAGDHPSGGVKVRHPSIDTFYHSITEPWPIPIITSEVTRVNNLTAVDTLQ